MDVGLIIIDIFGEVEGSDSALHLLKAWLPEELDIRSVAFLSSVEVNL
jgi:hypothetical protein